MASFKQLLVYNQNENTQNIEENRLLIDSKQPAIKTSDNLEFNSLHLNGDFSVDGTININNLVQNDITINNEILVSTQLDIKNEGTGPALKVTQTGTPL